MPGTVLEKKKSIKFQGKFFTCDNEQKTKYPVVCSGEPINLHPQPLFGYFVPVRPRVFENNSLRFWADVDTMTFDVSSMCSRRSKQMARKNTHPAAARYVMYRKICCSRKIGTTADGKRAKLGRFPKLAGNPTPLERRRCL